MASYYERGRHRWPDVLLAIALGLLSAAIAIIMIYALAIWVAT
jgi:hypothetical protein